MKYIPLDTSNIGLLYEGCTVVLNQIGGPKRIARNIRLRRPSDTSNNVNTHEVVADLYYNDPNENYLISTDTILVYENNTTKQWLVTEGPEPIIDYDEDDSECI